MTPATIQVGQVIPATVVPLEADGVTPTPGAVVSEESWSVSDPTIASLVSNADGSASLTGVAAGEVTVSVSATVTDTNGAVSQLSATNTLTVEAAPPPPPPTPLTASIEIAFGPAA